MSKYSLSRVTSAGDIDSAEILESRTTIDGAVMRARELSEARGKFGGVFIVWTFDGKGRREVRAYAQAGKVRWARPCTASGKDALYNHSGCVVCGGLGLIEDYPS